MWSSLTIRLALLLVVITTVVMVCFIGLRFWINWVDFNRDIEAKFERITARISSSVNPTIWDIYKKSLNRNYSKEIATAILDAELADPYLVAIKVYGNFGHLFMGKIKISESQILTIDPTHHDPLLKKADNRRLYPIRTEGMTIGYVEVFFTEAPMHEQLMSRLLLEIVQMIFIAGVVIIFLFYALKISLVRPLLALQTAKHALESMSDGVVIMAPDGQIVEVNNAFMDQSGYMLQEVDHKKVDLFSEISDTAQPVSNLWTQVEEKDFWVGEVNAVRKDGSHYPALLSITTVFGEAGETINRVMVIRDNTKEYQNRKIEHRLQHTQRMETMGALAGGIAHDINNVLTPIMGWAEVLADDLSKKDSSKHGAEQILKGALRAKGMIDQIMDFSRMNKTQAARVVDLTDLIHGSLSFIRATFPAAIKINTELPNNKLEVFGDPGKIEQVLINVFTNAMHAMEKEGGILSIAAGKNTCTAAHPASIIDGPLIHISISDTGSGIKDDVLDKIFEPFFTTKGSGKGNGFGLSTSMGILNRMGGTISVQSQPGEGSTFHIWLPLADSQVQTNEKQTITHSPAADKITTERFLQHLSEKQIMLVDDEKDNLTLGENILGRFGCNTSSFQDSKIALKRFQETPYHFDILITDQSMQNLQGHELATATRKVRPELPIIVLTGHNLYETEKKYANIGNIHLIRKPFSKQELQSALMHVLFPPPAINKPVADQDVEQLA